ncbi:MAG: hypothetical protein EXR50_01065 [Dehalococcoidia bacterium]|nr:hypothetical protein [Dehalococcoidia bacterium]
MLNIVLWWAVIAFLGIIAFPYLFPLLKNLPDRGYSIAKTFGLLAVSYCLWIFVSFDLMPNARGSIILLICLLALVSGYLWSKQRNAIAEFISQYRTLLLAEEAVFMVSFFAWAVIRAYNPQIDATEKPMDFAFLNSAIRSPSFPPLDPWLSGHTISYYYLGYVIFGGLIQLTAIPSSVGYNLALALIFALASVSVFGLVCNLMRLASLGSRKVPYLAGATGVLFVLIAGNLEVLLELARSHGLGSAGFWGWLGVKELYPTYVSPHWYPTDNWWWWRASRVIGTTVGDGASDVTITEFPFFSFLLGDLHPHVMALPFAAASVTLAMDVFTGRKPTSVWPIRDKVPYIAMAALLIGSFGALNSWDLPTYCGTLLLAGLVSQLRYYGFATRREILGFVLWCAAIAITAVLLYLPFYLTTGFELYRILGPNDAKNGQGLPVALWDGPYSRPIHLAIFWGLFLFIVLSFIAAAVAVSSKRAKRSFAAVALLPAIALIAVEAIISTAGNLTLLAGGPQAVLLEIAQRWWAAPPVLVIGFVLFSRALARRPSALIWDQTDIVAEEGRGRAVDFVMLMVMVGLLLIAACETVYIKDVFHNRMNTVFKLYYQAWLFLGLSSAFAVFYLHNVWKPQSVLQSVGKYCWMATAAVLLLSTTLYPVAAIIDKTSSFRGPATLDGIAFAAQRDRDEAQAITWLKEQDTDEPPVVLEATGDEYSSFGRVSSRTGFPTVLGWYGHEVQWRGRDAGFRERPKDIDAMYSTADKRQVMELFKKYGVSFVFVGSLERGKYPQGLGGFSNFMDVAFQNSGVTIYKVP